MSATRPTVAVIGLGAMGSRLALNLLSDGFVVVVANRSPSATQGLVAAGASVAASPHHAARRSDVVLVTVTDDTASRQVWTDPDTGILREAGDDQVLIECSTVSPTWVRELAELAGSSGARFLEAPMVGSRAQVEGRSLVHLIGGSSEVLDEARVVLAVSAPRIHHCGAHGTAATSKLLVNALLAVQVAAAAELLGVAQGSGLSLDATVELLTSLPVASPAFTRAAHVMLQGRHPPQFPVDLVAKDLRYLAAAAADAGRAAPMSAAAREGYETAAALGRGSEDLTALARLFVQT